MNRRLFAASMAFVSFLGLWALDFEGYSLQPVMVSAESSSGLEAIYVVPGGQPSARIVYEASSQQVRWYRFSNLGGAYAEEVATDHSGNRWSIPVAGTDMGYIIEDGSTRHCYWVVDYQAHRFDVSALAA